VESETPHNGWVNIFWGEANSPFCHPKKYNFYHNHCGKCFAHSTAELEIREKNLE
jgi:hypothetical protein